MAAHGQATVAAILVAAGSGTRLGAGKPKAFCEVGGRTLLDHALQRFVGHDLIRDVIVVVPADYAHEVNDPAAHVVAGGALRRDSVAARLAALAPDIDLVLVHDAARPFVPAAVITRVVQALIDGAQAVVPAVPVVDTVKRVFEDVVVETIDRSALRAIQTPQGFHRDALVAAHAAGGAATDDASMAERIGIAVVVVEGSEESFKITTPWDLRVAESLVTPIQAARP
jgi:2-C-methyl-D-erythritol 4-phosphate cytidylyltransferase